MDNGIKNNATLRRTWFLLKITYGLYWGIIGADKFFGIVTESHNRVSKLTLNSLPFSLETLLIIVGILELIIAALILSRWTRLGTLLGITLMAIIVINLIAMGNHHDIAIHGTTIAIGMVAYYALTTVIDR